MRISLAGGGTDVPPLARAGGRVVCAAIDLFVRATVEPFDDGWIRLEGTWGLADVGRPIAPGERARTHGPERTHGPAPERTHSMLPIAGNAPPRVATLTRRAGELPSKDPAFRLLEAVRERFGVTGGARISIESDLTFGTGLGGSAAAAVALVAAFHEALGERATAPDLATTAAHLERDVLGLRCGLQDQVCASNGGILDVRFYEVGHGKHVRGAAVETGGVGFDLESIEPTPALARDLCAGLLLVDTRVRRVSGEVLDVANNSSISDLSADLVAAADDTARGFRLGSLPLVLAGMRRSASAKWRRGGAGALPRDVHKKLLEQEAVVVRACGAGQGGHILVWADPSRHSEIENVVSPALLRRPTLGVSGVQVSV
ncbi:MAG: hypothetical protein IPK82_07100 [Polyangiaceae bacterium]|nr:hypothetical protein [Polyangiaceae bacterium]